MEGLLSATHQPQSYIVKSLREKERRVKELQAKVREVEAQLNQSVEERAKLVETKNQMALDLEKLLSHKEVSSGRGTVGLVIICIVHSQELHHMKQVLVGVANKVHQRPLESSVEPALHVPPPTLFVSSSFSIIMCNNSHGIYSLPQLAMLIQVLYDLLTSALDLK